MPDFRITHALPAIWHPSDMTAALVGVEFFYDSERSATVLAAHPELPHPHSAFLAVPIQDFFAGLRQSTTPQTIAATPYWEQAMANCPMFYIPVGFYAAQETHPGD